MNEFGSSSYPLEGLKAPEYSSGGVDRISDLADEILAAILSFLPIKNAVGTSVLSHRWRYLFTLVKKFDFDEFVFFNEKSDPRVLSTERLAFLRAGRKCPSIFKDFVDRVLLVNKPAHISSFRLNCGLGFDCSNVDAWITFALRGGVTELDIFVHEYDSSVLPPSLFSCKTLVVLKLGSYSVLMLPESFQLPNLKSLELSTVILDGVYCFDRLVSGCPVLEDLVLLGVWEEINLCSPSVRRLTMGSRERSNFAPSERTNIDLDLPNLLYFYYGDYLPFHYLLKNLNSVVEARLDFIFDGESIVREPEEFVTPFLELANGFSAAKLLYFGGKCITGLHYVRDQLPTFGNLTRLELGWTRYLSWRVALPGLLNSAPKLEILVFLEGIMHCEEDGGYVDMTFWSNQCNAPPCLSHLKLIVIYCFHGYNEEMQIAEYLLRHINALKSLVIDWIMKTKEDREGFNKLKKLGASKGCKVTGDRIWDGDME